MSVQTNDQVSDPMLLALEDMRDMGTSDLLKALGVVTNRYRELSARADALDKQAKALQEIVIQRMSQSDTQSTKVALPDGSKMSFTLTSKMYPKMLVPSPEVVDAFQRYAMRLAHEGNDLEAEEIMSALTIKGASLSPVLSRWANTITDDPDDTALPEELRGVIEIATSMTLYKRNAR